MTKQITQAEMDALAKRGLEEVAKWKARATCEHDWGDDDNPSATCRICHGHEALRDNWYRMAWDD